jgi:hypothetical protein
VRAAAPQPVSGPVTLRIGEVSVPASVDGTAVEARFAVDELLATASRLGDRRALKAGVGPATATVRAPSLPSVSPLIRRRGLRFYVVRVTKDQTGQVMFAISPLTPRRVVAHLRRDRRQGGK